jgi:hypothetical protein
VEKRIKLIIEDALAFMDPYLETYVHNPDATQTHDYFFRVPDSWLVNGALPPDKLETLFCHIYGPTWRSGNDDGSLYVIVRHQVTEATDPREWQGKNCRRIDNGKVVDIQSEEY